MANPNAGTSPFGSNQDIDELIRNIDKQIAAIEEEERKEKEKQAKENTVQETSVYTEPEKADEPEKITDYEVQNDIEFKPVPKEDEKEPTVSEIIPSNDINLENFELKEKEEKKPEVKESDYDDFFDDFFDE